MQRSEPVLTTQGATAAYALPVPSVTAPAPRDHGPRPSRARRRRIALVVSALLHLLALAVLLFLPKSRPVETPPPPGMDMLFEPGVQTPTQVPGPEPLPSAPLAAPAPPSREPPREVTPTPPAPQQPPAPLAPPVPPAPPAITAPPQPPTPFTAPEPAEPPPLPPPVPEATEPAPLPPPPVPQPPREAASRPTTPPRPAHPRQTAPATAGAFPHPTFSALGNMPGGALEGMFAARRPGGSTSQPFHQTSGAPVGNDWQEQFREWIETHKYYPEQAAKLGQEGVVTVEIRIAPDGRVTSLQLRQKSGSPWLDLGLQAMFRDARVPPLPPGGSNVTFEINMTYRLIR